MKKPADLANKLLTSIWNNYKHESGKMLLHLGAIGWVVSSIAQICAIVINKKINKDDKKFLIPQEAFDGLINAGFYYIITDTCLTISNKLVESGKFLNQKLHKNILENIFKTKENTADIKQLSNLVKNEKATLTKIMRNQLSKAPTESLEKLLGAFTKFKNAAGIGASILASIVSCNLVTPIIRNKIAAEIQKKALDKNKTIPKKPYPNTVLCMTQISPKQKELYKDFISIKSNSTMKV